jgi:hypothetical protein
LFLEGVFIMRRHQFDDLIRRIGGRYRMAPTIEIRVTPTEGARAGDVGVVQGVSGSEVLLKFPGDPDIISLSYTKVDLLGADGMPEIVPITDMTGRQINIDAVICYSVNEGSGHALEIGRVVKVHDSGLVSVTPLVHNGQKLTSAQKRNRTYRVRQDRSILLPCDEHQVLIWLLSDFSVLSEDVNTGGSA